MTRESPTLRSSDLSGLLSHGAGSHRHDGRSEGISATTSTFVHAALEARYIKSTASSFRAVRFIAVFAALVAALAVNFCIVRISSSDFQVSLWANSPLNFSLSLFVLGLYTLEPRKSTIRMHQEQQIATGLLAMVTGCLVYTAFCTLQSGAYGFARLQRALELHIGGLLFIFVISMLCETLAVVHTLLVTGVWAFGWAFTVYNIDGWGIRGAVWAFSEGMLIVFCKLVLEAGRRRRWLHMLRMEGELRALGEFNRNGIKEILDDSSDGGHNRHEDDSRNVPGPSGQEFKDTYPMISSWFFGTEDTLDTDPLKKS